jgi:AraC-like DNA-binding protein
MTSKREIAGLFFLASACLSASVISAAASVVDTPCISFESPVQASLIASGSCTLSVRACPDAQSIRLNVRYGLSNGKSDTLVDLGTIAQPPFKLVWNTADIPNQLFKGMVFSADAIKKNKTHQYARMEGIFLYNKSRSAPAHPAAILSDLKKTPLFIDTLIRGRDSIFVRVSGKYAEGELLFTVLVVDRLFSSNLSKDKMATAGVEALLGPGTSKTPFPTEKSVIVVIPLLDKPYRLLYKNDIDPDGKFDISMSSAEYPYQTTVKKADGKGYRIDVSVPKEVFGGAMPDSLACNILVKVLDKEGQLHISSLCGAEGNSAYCPLLWTEIKRGKRGFPSNALLVFGAGFLVGIALIAAGKRAYSLVFGNTVDFNKFELGIEDKKTMEAIYDFIEQNVTKKEFSIHDTAIGLSLTGPKIDGFLRKYTGKSFKLFVMKSRVEIAKERLRSSHAGQTSVADSCGFKNVDEMTKFFKLFYRTTPAFYRRENQVA